MYSLLFCGFFFLIVFVFSKKRKQIRHPKGFFIQAVFVKFVVLEKSQKPAFSPHNVGFIGLFEE